MSLLSRLTPKPEPKKPVSPDSDPNSIGNLAVERGFITKTDLSGAVAVQQRRLPLGEILVEMGKLTKIQLEELLFEQRVRRGEIKDKQAIYRYERRRLEYRLSQVRDGFKEASTDLKNLTDHILNIAVVK